VEPGFMYEARNQHPAVMKTH